MAVLDYHFFYCKHEMATNICFVFSAVLIEAWVGRDSAQKGGVANFALAGTVCSDIDTLQSIRPYLFLD